MSETQKKLAVLIDGENVSRATLETIMQAVEELGRPVIKRVYADWTNPHNANWKNIILKYAISPVQQFNYTPGKNSSDFALLLDALEIAADGKAEGFCIVTSDADFTPLVIKLRQAGMFVAGIGERKSHRSFVSACDTFVYTDEGPVAAPAPTVTRTPVTPARTARSGAWSRAAREHKEAPHVFVENPAPQHAPQPRPEEIVKEAPAPKSESRPVVNFHPMLVQSLSTNLPAPTPAATPARPAYHAPSAQELLAASKAAEVKTETVEKVEKPQPKPAKPAGKTVETMEELLLVVKSIMEEAKDAEGWTTLTRVDSDIHKKLPGFDAKQFNFNRLITLLKTSASLEIEMRNPNGGGMAYYIRPVQEKTEEAVQPAVQPAEQSAEKPAAPAPKAEKPAPKTRTRKTKKPAPEAAPVEAAQPTAEVPAPVEAEAKPVKRSHHKKPAATEDKPAAKKPARKTEKPQQSAEQPVEAAAAATAEAPKPVKRSHHKKPAVSPQEQPAEAPENEKQ